MNQAGRRPGPTATRQEILAAARRLFGQRGYAGTTIRAIAAEAGVNPALVHHFFRTKEQVFVAALEFPIQPAAVLAMLQDGPREEIGERTARFIVSVWREPDSRASLLAILRSAMTRDESAVVTREFLSSVALIKVSTTLGVEPLRVIGAIGQAVGVMVLRYVVGLEPLASASEDEVVALIAPTFQRALGPGPEVP
ncbi:MAG: TetR family transcriptional regulator [Mycobacteriales bacterium]